MKDDIVFPPKNNIQLRLAVQAGLYFITDKEKSKVDENGTLHLETLNVYDHFDLEKFTELIVKECIDTMKNSKVKCHLEMPVDDAIHLLSKEIKQHFGVKL